MFGITYLLKKATRSACEAFGMDAEDAKGVGMTIAVISGVSTLDFAGLAGSIGEELFESATEEAVEEAAETTSSSLMEATSPVQFGSSVEFADDGTVIEDPHQDALGNYYKTHDDWINGTNPYNP